MVIIELNISFQDLLCQYFQESSLVLYLGEEGSSAIIRWYLVSGCRLRTESFSLGFESVRLCVCVHLHVCTLQLQIHLCERECGPGEEKWTKMGSIK